jgi:hypothetical protein
VQRQTLVKRQNSVKMSKPIALLRLPAISVVVIDAPSDDDNAAAAAAPDDDES